MCAGEGEMQKKKQWLVALLGARMHYAILRHAPESWLARKVFSDWEARERGELTSPTPHPIKFSALTEQY